MRNRRDRRLGNKLCIHITNRLIVGLPFIPTCWMALIIKSVMAKGQSLYPVQVVGFMWMSNHYHLILCGRAQNISKFKNYLHGELAKHLKRLLPNFYQSKVWKNRGNEQVLETAEDVLLKLVYLYANPARANLANTITDYPGLSSWRMFTTDSHTFDAQWVPPRVEKATGGRFTAKRDQQFLSDLKQRARKATKEVHRFTLQPFVWKRCFAESRKWTDEAIRRMVLERVASAETELQRERGQKPVVGKRTLLLSAIDKLYRPTSNSPTPFLQCSIPELRRECIRSYRQFCQRCREVWQEWSKGNFSVPFPAGAYRPGFTIVFFHDRPAPTVT